MSDEKVLSKLRKCKYAIMEIITTERTYVKKLRVLEEHIITPLQTQLSKGGLFSGWEVISSDKFNQLFRYIGMLHKLNKGFLLDLEQIIGDAAPAPVVLDRDPGETAACVVTLCAKFLEYGPFFKMYSQFISSHTASDGLMREERKKKSKFIAFLESKTRQVPELGGQSLEAFLILPIQRITRYENLLKALSKHLPAEDLVSGDDRSTVTAAHAQLRKATALISNVAKHVNELVRRHEAYMEAMEVQRQFVETDDTFNRRVLQNLVSPTRRLMCKIDCVHQELKLAVEQRESLLVACKKAREHDTTGESKEQCGCVTTDFPARLAKSKGSYTLPVSKISSAARFFVFNDLLLVAESVENKKYFLRTAIPISPAHFAVLRPNAAENSAAVMVDEDTGCFAVRVTPQSCALHGSSNVEDTDKTDDTESTRKTRALSPLSCGHVRSGNGDLLCLAVLTDRQAFCICFSDPKAMEALYATLNTCVAEMSQRRRGKRRSLRRQNHHTNLFGSEVAAVTDKSSAADGDASKGDGKPQVPVKKKKMSRKSIFSSFASLFSPKRKKKKDKKDKRRASEAMSSSGDVTKANITTTTTTTSTITVSEDRTQTLQAPATTPSRRASALAVTATSHTARRKRASTVAVAEGAGDGDHYDDLDFNDSASTGLGAAVPQHHSDDESDFGDSKSDASLDEISVSEDTLSEGEDEDYDIMGDLESLDSEKAKEYLDSMGKPIMVPKYVMVRAQQRLRDSVSEFEQLVNVLLSEKNEIREELNLFERKAEQLASKLTLTQAELDSEKRSLECIKSAFAKMKEELVACKARNQELVLDATSMKESKDDQPPTEDGTDHNVSRSENVSRQCDEGCFKLQAQMLVMRARVQANESMVSSLEKRLADMCGELHAQRQAHSNALSRQKDEFGSALHTLNARENSESTSLRAEFESKLKAMQQREKDLDDLLNNMEDRLYEEKDECEKVTGERDSLKLRCDELVHKNAALKEVLASLGNGKTERRQSVLDEQIRVLAKKIAEEAVDNVDDEDGDHGHENKE